MIENARRYALGFMRANAGMFLVFSVVVMALTPVMAIILAQITELPEERALRMIFDTASLYIIWQIALPVTGLFLGELIMVELVYLALVRAIKWSESWTN